MEHSVRKVSKTQNGAKLLTVTEFIPDDWSYVEINERQRTKDSVTLEISVLTKGENNNAVSNTVSTTPEQVG